jgi:hypothetical protein
MADGESVAGSRRLTEALLCPLRPLDVDRRGSVRDVAAQMPLVLANLAVPGPGGGSFRLTDHDVRAALTSPDRAFTLRTPFAWSSRTSRRSLGVAAVRTLVNGEARSPMEAVHAAVTDAIDSARAADRPASSMERWLSTLPTASVAAVQAEAVTWATRLWCALDWSGLGGPPIIGRDVWWDSPHSSLLAIRSRAEVRSVCVDHRGDPFSVHLVVLGGPRRPTVRSELSAVALVEALCAPRSLLPGRVVGWWPDSGHFSAVEVDEVTLRAGVDAVARTLAWVAEARTAPQAELGSAA